MRPYCPQCHYPEKTCLCEHIHMTSTALEVIIIQHPKEANHAKNTAKLVALSIPSTSIINAHDVEAMTALSRRIDLTTTLLVYPNDNSVPIEALGETTKQAISAVILIDGSWKQAFGIVKQHPWLQTLTSVHFATAPSSTYAIRHTSLSHALSTLEATAYSLATLDNADVSALYKLQGAMQAQWQGPKGHLRSI